MADFDKSRLGDYVDVAARIAEFRTKHPDGSLQPADPTQPYRIETIGDRTFVVVVAAAYRSPDDSRPGIGMAYEPFPGRTPYTKDSELMNAETSAWGRAIVAVLAADTKRGLASREEVENRQVDRKAATAKLKALDGAIANARSEQQLKTAWDAVLAAVEAGEIGPDDAQRFSTVVKLRRDELATQQPDTVPPDTDNPPSQKQTAAMHALFRDAGIGQDDKYGFMSTVLSEKLPQPREITSAKQLSADDVSLIITRLRERLRAKEAENATAAAAQ